MVNNINNSVTPAIRRIFGIVTGPITKGKSAIPRETASKRSAVG
jgi:hypothetical protein